MIQTPPPIRHPFMVTARVMMRPRRDLIAAAPIAAIALMATGWALGGPAHAQVTETTQDETIEAGTIESDEGVPSDDAPSLLSSLDFERPTATGDDADALSSGEAIVDVRKDDSAADAAGLVTAGVEIDAAPAIIWDLMTNCANAPLFVKGLESCTVLEEGPDGAWDVREHVIDWSWIMPETRSVFRSEYDRPSTIAFERAGGDLKFLQGIWRLEEIAPGRTRVWYQSRVAVNAPVPGFMIRNAVRKDTRDVLLALKAESEAAANAQGG